MMLHANSKCVLLAGSSYVEAAHSLLKITIFVPYCSSVVSIFPANFGKT